MQKIVHVNLGGRPYVLNDDAYTVLSKYLEQTTRALVTSPDQAEILQDIESAIATKATGESAKAVLSRRDIEKAIAAIGPVEAESDKIATAHDTADGDRAPEPRRFFTIPSEGKLLGVCAGVAAYLGMDITLVRVLFVLLIFVTQGMWILVYLVLAIAAPAAKTASEIAEAHGRPVTAQEIIDRVQRGVPEGTAVRTGRVLTQIGRVVTRITAIVVGLAAGLLSAFWAWVIWAILLGQTTLKGALAGFGSGKQLALVTALYIACVIPLVGLMRLLQKVSSSVTDKRGWPVLPAGVWAFWAVITVMVIGFMVAFADSLRQYVRTNDGYLHVGTHQICIDANQCSDGIVEKQYQ
ncbi:MAG TPA: PspC domain-containing protein [Candidatus Saccharibacteria bacterium]|nr:PspC domain-containing protein [Candidatus Saccharibacteria bacterium]